MAKQSNALTLPKPKEKFVGDNVGEWSELCYWDTCSDHVDRCYQCPNGGKPVIVQECAKVVYYVECTQCRHRTAAHEKPIDAMDEWNAFQKRARRIIRDAKKAIESGDDNHIEDARAENNDD